MHQLPSAPELFAFGQILDLRAYQAEFANPAAYARRVFGTEARDPAGDQTARPPNFQPFVPIDDTHGYYSEIPKRRRSAIARAVGAPREWISNVLERR